MAVPGNGGDRQGRRPQFEVSLTSAVDRPLDQRLLDRSLERSWSLYIERADAIGELVEVKAAVHGSAEDMLSEVFNRVRDLERLEASQGSGDRLQTVAHVRVPAELEIGAHVRHLKFGDGVVFVYE